MKASSPPEPGDSEEDEPLGHIVQEFDDGIAFTIGPGQSFEEAARTIGEAWAKKYRNGEAGPS